jgi:hypothetical protein
MNNQFDFPDFIERVVNMGHHEMIHAAEAEAYAAEMISSGIKASVKNSRAGSPQYVRRLKKFLFFLNYGRIPHRADAFDVSLYKKVAQALVDKGDFDKSALDIF